MHRLRYLAIAVMLAATACGGQTIPAPVAGSSPNLPISIVGTERIGWYQMAADASQVSRYQYTAYVDDAPFALGDAFCQSSATTVFTCTASLPQMSVGPHRIEITSSETAGSRLESARSSPIYVVVVAANAATAIGAASVAARVITTFDGTRVAVETLATGLDAPSALAATADGRIFVAQGSGDVSVWQGGQILSTPAVRLSDVQRVSGMGLVGMTLHPEFATNGRVYMACMGRSRNGALVNRIIRFRELNNVFGEAAVILEDPVAVVSSRPPRIRFGPDRKLYIAFPAADWPTADSSASYAGKILRFNDDGTTPRDNPQSSPIISAGHAVTGGFDWQPNSGRFWLTERDRQGRDVLGSLSPAFESALAASFESAVDASGTAFYPAGLPGAFTNDLFIAGLAGQQLRRVHFNPRDATRVDSTERLLEGQYGRLSDVIAGPDGVLYLSTSNRGLASAAADDDRLLRLIPAKP